MPRLEEMQESKKWMRPLGLHLLVRPLRFLVALAVTMGTWMKNAGDRTERPDYGMVPDHAKLADVAICLIAHAQGRGIAPTRHQLHDALFLADVAHLARYTRPISYDRYVATRHGPAAATFDAMLSKVPGVLRRTAPVAWASRHRADGAAEYHSPEREADDRRALSPSDIRLLRAAMDEVLDCPDAAPGARTKAHRAYTEALDEGREGTRVMDFALFFDPPSSEEAARLAWISRRRP